MIDRVPCVIVGAEGEALFVVRCMGEEGPALAGVLLNLSPEQVADTCGRVADEDACGDFEEPAGEEAPQAGRAVGEDDNGHQLMSESL